MNNSYLGQTGIKIISVCAVVFLVSGCGPKMGKNKNLSDSTEFFKEIGSSTEENNAEMQPTAEATQNASIDTTAQVPGTSPSTTIEAEAPAATAAASSGFEKPSIEKIQEALKIGNFYQGKIDGVAGPKTKKAIEEFQAQNNLKVDGKVGPQTWQKLKNYYNESTTVNTSSEPPISAKVTDPSQDASSQGTHD